MKKNILLSTLTFCLLSSSLGANDLGVVTIKTATKSEKNIEGVAASVIVITKEDIQKIAAQSLKDIINKTSGLNIQYGTFPSASSKSKSSISIRGMSANGTLFLLDGRRLSGEVKNPYDLDRIPASIIERIEIVKGPVSSLYGADAVGGVINIITKKPSEKPEISFGFRYGQNKDGEAQNRNADFSVRGSKNDIKYSFYTNKVRTTPFTQIEKSNVLVKQIGGVNSKTKQKPSNLTKGTPSYKLSKLKDNYNYDVSYKEKSDVLSLGGRLEYDINDKNSIGLDINSFKEELEGSYIGNFHPSNIKIPNKGRIPVFNIPVNTTDDNRRTDIGLDFKSFINEDLTLQLKAYKSYYKKRNTTTVKYFKELGYKNEEDSANSGMKANVDIISYDAMINYFLTDKHLLTSGIEIRDEKREATVFDNTPNLSTKNVDYKSFYLQDEWQIKEDLNAIIGTRYDKVSNAQNKTTFRLGLIKNFTKEFNVRTIFSQGYRTPDIREMYINKQTPNGLQQGADVIGYDLKPEFTNSYELGVNGKFEKISYDLVFFVNDIKDRISQIQKSTPKKAYYTFENISKAQTKGIELDLSYMITNNFNAIFNYTELRTKDKNNNKELEFNPKRTIALTFDYNLINSLNMMTSAKYIGKQFYMKNKKENRTNDFTLVDMNLDYKLNKLVNIYGGINNIFDKKVDDILGSSIGTYYFTGIRVNF